MWSLVVFLPAGAENPSKMLRLSEPPGVRCMAAQRHSLSFLQGLTSFIAWWGHNTARLHLAAEYGHAEANRADNIDT